MRRPLFVIFSLFISLLSFSIFLFIKPQTAHASSNFITDYNVIYTVDKTTLTHAFFQVTLTNTTSEFFASSYKMQVGFDDIENLRAADPLGPVNLTVKKTPDGNELNLIFNKHVVGKGKKLTFSVNFDTKDVANAFGQIREINIPGIAHPSEFNSFNVEIKVPQSFGSPAFIKPSHYQEGLLFTKDELKRSGISIEFGKIQAYKFSLVYHLKNQDLFPKDTEIALPPTTNYQIVSIQTISPKPKNVRLDRDGNWLATYTLLPSQILKVTVVGQANVSLIPRQEDLSDADRAVYIAPQPYWQSDDPKIKGLARQLKTPEAIYNYVVDTLHYDFSRVTDNKPRLGAVSALQNPSSAVCLEFTDLFIALARSAGIPAREVDGYAQTENTKLRPLSLVKDILHAWPEYYDSNRRTWIMVDPTWGSTTGGVDYFHTLDFDHLAFAIKGMSSTEPVPAGGYKLAEGKDKKDIQITFTTPKSTDVQQFHLDTNILSPYPAGSPISGTIIVRNVGETMTDPQQIVVLSNYLYPPQQNIAVPQILPFGYAAVPLSFAATPLLTNNTYTYTIRLGQHTLARSLEVSPFVLTRNRAIGGGVLLVIFTIIIFVITARSRRVRLPR